MDVIPRIYDTERVVRVLGENGEHKMVPINKEIVVKGPNGLDKVVKFDLTVGKYDVNVATGPSFQTRRQEAGEGMTQFMQAFPPAAPLIGDLLAELQDWPQADKVKERLQTLLPPQLQPPQMGPDGQPLPPPPPPPDPAMMEMQAKQQAQQAQMQMDMEMAQNKAQLEAQQSERDAQMELQKQNQAATIAAQKAQADAEIRAYAAKEAADLAWWVAAQELEIEKWKLSVHADIEDQKMQKQNEREGKGPAAMKTMQDMMAQMHQKLSEPPKVRKVRTWRDPVTDELHGEAVDVPAGGEGGEGGEMAEAAS